MDSPKKRGGKSKKPATPKKTKQPAAPKTTGKKSVDIANKQYMAKILYTKEQLPQNVVAERVGISTNTMSKWVGLFNWDALRKRLLISRDEELTNLYEQLSELNAEIRNSTKRRPDSAQADVQSKLASTIRTLETDLAIADLTTAGIRFMKYLQGKCTHAELIWLGDHWNDFIQASMKKN